MMGADREYFLLPDFKRDGKTGSTSQTAWCAAAAVCAWFTCYDPAWIVRLPRLAFRGSNWRRDAREAGRFYNGEGQPGEKPRHFSEELNEMERHAATVLEWKGHRSNHRGQ